MGLFNLPVFKYKSFRTKDELIEWMNNDEKGFLSWSVIEEYGGYTLFYLQS